LSPERIIRLAATIADGKQIRQGKTKREAGLDRCSVALVNCFIERAKGFENQMVAVESHLGT
jgi:hypothetical protein